MFVEGFHDALVLYAIALQEALSDGFGPKNGSEITARMWNRTFEGESRPPPLCWFRWDVRWDVCPAQTLLVDPEIRNRWAGVHGRQRRQERRFLFDGDDGRGDGVVRGEGRSHGPDSPASAVLTRVRSPGGGELLWREWELRAAAGVQRRALHAERTPADTRGRQGRVM